jgi:hypothetical protein
VGRVAGRRAAGAWAAITVQMVVGADIYELPCTLTFRADQPFEVGATFYTGEVYVRWAFSRELMWEGLRGPAGLGDVVIRPQWGDRQPQLLIELRVGPQEAVLQADRALIEGFLNETFDIVAMGSECLWPDPDVAPPRNPNEWQVPPDVVRPPAAGPARALVARSPRPPSFRRSCCRQPFASCRCRVTCPSARRLRIE